MNLNEDIVPANLDESVNVLNQSLTEQEKSLIKEMSHVNLHLTVGQLIRNQWSLWDKDTILVKWFHNKYGIDHADDVSAVIMDCLVCDLNNTPRRADKLASDFKEHWETHKNKIK